MNVFDITIEHAALMAEIEELNGEITPEIAARLNINESNLNTKIRAYYHIIKTTESQINLAKDEQERLNNVRKVKENLIKRLKTTVDIAVEEFGIIKKDAKAKSLDLGDLKVWQKKTEAMDVIGEIDDERFCNKQLRFEYSYPQAKEFLTYLEETTYADDVSINIIVLKDQLKQWLLDNEEEHKELLNKAKEILPVNFEESNDNIQFVGTPQSEEEKDLTILLATNIKHNSTVIFK